jgi:hypothetical protein
MSAVLDGGSLSAWAIGGKGTSPCRLAIDKHSPIPIADNFGCEIFVTQILLAFTHTFALSRVAFPNPLSRPSQKLIAVRTPNTAYAAAIVTDSQHAIQTMTTVLLHNNHRIMAT